MDFSCLAEKRKRRAVGGRREKEGTAPDAFVSYRDEYEIVCVFFFYSFLRLFRSTSRLCLSSHSCFYGIRLEIGKLIRAAETAAAAARL